MFISAFRNRRINNPQALTHAHATAQSRSGLVKIMYGYVLHEMFVVEDDGRVTRVECSGLENQARWARHARHVPTQSLEGRGFHHSYRFQICETRRKNCFFGMNHSDAQCRLSLGCMV